VLLYPVDEVLNTTVHDRRALPPGNTLKSLPREPTAESQPPGLNELIALFLAPGPQSPLPLAPC
jgi:hypothetical protein